MVISSRSQRNVAAAVAQLRALGLEVSGTVAHALKDRAHLISFTVQTYGGIDVVVCNAAVSLHFGPFMETTAQVAMKTLEMNVVAQFLLVKDALPYLEKSTQPAVLVLSSYVAYQPNHMLGFYSISKTALLSLTKCMAMELALKGIRVTGIAPAIIKTDFSKPIWEAAEASNNPMGRMGLPEEVASVAAFLLSKEAEYVSGETVVVAGGLPTRL